MGKSILVLGEPGAARANLPKAWPVKRRKPEHQSCISRRAGIFPGTLR